MLFDKLKKYYMGDEESYPKKLSEYERAAAEAVDNYRKENSASKGETALAALSIYNNFMLTPPGWAIETIRETWEKYEDGIGCGWQGEPNENQLETFVTFDDALGLKPRTKAIARAQTEGARSARSRQKQKHLTFHVHLELMRLYKEGFYTDDTIYIEAGKKFAISGGAARKYYQAALALGHPTLSGQPKRERGE